MKTVTGKAERQKMILKIIREAKIATQMELREALRARGVECDQATVSRDIRELALVKVADERGRYHYTLLEEASPTLRATKLGVLKRFIKTVEWSGNIVVIKTDPGNAPAVGEALDHLAFPEIIGTVAGDNTLLVVVREGTPARKAAEKILKEAGK